MRRLRPLLLLAIVVILAGIAILYRAERARQLRSAPAIPKPLPPEANFVAPGWSWSKTGPAGTEVELKAGHLKQLKNPSRVYLEDVVVQIFAKDGTTYDRFTTDEAEFDTQQAVLFADADVQINTGEPVGNNPPGNRVSITTSGLTFKSASGRAETDRPTTFRFEQGEGRSVGASYDPEYRELQLHSQAEVVWRGKAGKAVPLKVSGGELIYKERDSAVVLSSKSRLTRASMVVDAERGIVWLDEGDVRRVEAVAARGLDQPEPGRQLEYAADQVYIDFGPAGAIERIAGDGNARMASTERTSRTTINGRHFNLEFEVKSGTSQLRRALAEGQAVVESEPRAPKSSPAAQTRVMRSEGIELLMRAGGREIQSVRTQAPGTIEFIPNQPGQSRRRLEGERIWITYGSENHIRSLDATNAVTRTEPPRPAGKPSPPPMLTWSKQLRADFDAQGRELAQLDQSGDFRYEQGDRRGRAERAVFQPAENLVRLTGSARFWDPAGSLSASRILLRQATGDVEAEENVATTREPESKGQPTAVITATEPFHGRASRMISLDSGRVVRYDGNVVLWQGGNRLQADHAVIDRNERTLNARGNVRTLFTEQTPSGKGKDAPLTTLVQAQALSYSERKRVAVYTGGVTMKRGGLDVTSSELRGVFSVDDGATVLDSATADGKVQILQPAPGRTRKGTAEHAEYVVKEAKVVLSGGNPEFTDSMRGSTRGRTLTWFADSDRLLVEGREKEPAVTRIRRN